MVNRKCRAGRICRGRRKGEGVGDRGGGEGGEGGSRPPDTAFHVVISFLHPGNNFINFRPCIFLYSSPSVCAAVPCYLPAPDSYLCAL